MEPFAHRRLGAAWLRSLNKPVFRLLMRLQGVADMSKVSGDELGAYVELLLRDDHGAAFLKIMRGFELTRSKHDLYLGVLSSDRYPAQVVWGERDPALKVTTQGEAARRAAGVADIVRLPAKHFLQEDQAPALAVAIAGFIRSSRSAAD